MYIFICIFVYVGMSSYMCVCIHRDAHKTYMCVNILYICTSLYDNNNDNSNDNTCVINNAMTTLEIGDLNEDERA